MKIYGYLCPLIGLSALLTLHAQETIVTLAPVIVTADALDDEENKNITNEDLTKRSATDLSDVFQKTPSVTVNGGRNQGQQIYVNGLESNLSNVIIDGAKQGNIFHHAGTVFVEPELLKQVGIDPGAGNALQGLGALNGALRFETKSAFDILAEDQGFAGLTKGLYYSNGEGYRASQSFAFRLSDDWAFLLSGSKTDRNEYEDGDGNTIDLTDYDSENFLLKLSGRFSGKHTLDIGFESVSTKTFAFDRFNVTEDFLLATGRPAGVLQRNELGRDSLTFNYGFGPDDSELIDFKATFGYSTQEYSRKTTDEYSQLDSLSLNIRNTSHLSDSFSSTYGVDYQRFDNDAKTVNLDPTDSGISTKGDENEIAYGVFLQNEWQFHQMASLSFGARYDHYDFETITGRDIASSKFSPNLALTLEPTDELTFVASYSQAYRGVGIREAFLPGDRAAAADGEEAETFKFTAKYERDGFFVSGTYFDQSIDNYLYPIALGRGGPNGSFGDIESDGYEFRVGFRRGGFSTSLAVADNSPDVRGYDYIDDLGVVVAGRRWILDSSYAFEESGITVGANIEHREEVDEVPLGRFPSVAGKNSYTLVNAFISWEVSQVEGLTISVNADNLFDKQYQDHTIYTASGFASPGREVRLGASYQF